MTLGVQGRNSISTSTANTVCPVDDFIQLFVALNTIDLYFVLERKVAVIHHAKLWQFICTARLPEDCFVLMSSCFYEIKGFSLCRYPLITFFYLQIYIQLT